ncbi:transcriptional regulator CynR [Rhizobium sp. P32RR-XVIII]|uniref:transcriptional regulator CynR n=1 Tax=Rhizobium sp. P32RR-XVIII TaxID=2726738 RepID=UPI0014578449|nr:transcriptional regulator CynR [Rhizobium sp. P32RR-XVIII]NLS04137.1 transcriptional regulator CynR [Rhizobium sp. P32RR-XVIII]
MEERLARYLISVVEQGSFTRAAEKLHVSQPALSQQIRHLEERLGVKLLDRSGKTVVATDIGKAYIGHAARALREFDAGKRAVHDVRNLDRGDLRLAFTPTFATYLIGPLTHLFLSTYPNITMTVDVLAQMDIEAGLMHDRFDLGIAPSHPESAEISGTSVGEEHLNCVVSPDHPCADLLSINSEVLSTLKLALFDRSFATRLFIDKHFRANRLQAKISVESNSLEALMSLVSYGVYATILPAFAGNRIAGTRSIPLSPAIATRPICLLKRADGYHSFASIAFEQMFNSTDWALPSTK